MTPFKSSSLHGMTFKTAAYGSSTRNRLQLTSVKTNTPLIVVFNTSRNHEPFTSSISFGTGEVSDIQTNETFGNFGAINYSRNLIVTGNAVSATINISGTYDSSDSGYIASLSALYFANT